MDVSRRQLPSQVNTGIQFQHVQHIIYTPVGRMNQECENILFCFMYENLKNKGHKICKENQIIKYENCHLYTLNISVFWNSSQQICPNIPCPLKGDIYISERGM